MKTRNLVLLIICSIVLAVSCKNDPKETEVVSENSEMTSQKGVATSNPNREKDSLQIVAKYKSGGKEIDPVEITKILDASEVKARQNLSTASGIPNVCIRLTPADIADAFGIDKSIIKESNGNRSQGEISNSKSCFWRWGTEGIVIQISNNPLPDEVDDWGKRYVNTKKSTGEQMMSSTERFVFTDYDGPGKYNVYNADLGKYYSTKGEELIISLIFNGNMNKKKQLQIAKQLMETIFDKI